MGFDEYTPPDKQWLIDAIKAKDPYNPIFKSLIEETKLKFPKELKKKKFTYLPYQK